MSIVLRDARADDVAALAALAAASYRMAFLPIIGEAGLALRGAPFFEERFAAEWPHIRIACDEHGALFGFSEVRARNLDMLFLVPGATGKGIGAKLLSDAEARGANTLECFAENAGARRFYRREGWRETAAYEREFAGTMHRFVALTKGIQAATG